MENMVTSRADAADNIFKYFDQRFKNLGFTDQQMEIYQASDQQMEIYQTSFSIDIQKIRLKKQIII